MKLILAAAILIAALWLGADWFGAIIKSGREAVSTTVAEPVHNLAGNVGLARSRVDETNRRIAEVDGQAAAVASGGTMSAYGPAARRQLEAAGVLDR